MKKRLIFVIGLLITVQIQTQVFSQVKSYDSRGKPTKSISDFLALDDGPVNRVAVGPILAALAGTGMQIYTTIKEKKQLTYTGVYANTFSMDNIPEQFQLKRLLIDDKEENGKLKYIEKEVASIFTFHVAKNKEAITISLESLLLKLSKACAKSKQRLGITIQLTLSYVDKEQAMTELGTENIIIPIVYVRKDPFDFTDPELKKFIKPATFGPLPEGASSKNVILGAKITEVNITKVDPTMVEMLMKNNGDSVKDLLAAILKKDDQE